MPYLIISIFLLFIINVSAHITIKKSKTLQLIRGGNGHHEMVNQTAISVYDDDSDLEYLNKQSKDSWHKIVMSGKFKIALASICSFCVR